MRMKGGKPRDSRPCVSCDHIGELLCVRVLLEPHDPLTADGPDVAHGDVAGELGGLRSTSLVPFRAVDSKQPDSKNIGLWGILWGLSVWKGLLGVATRFRTVAAFSIA